MDKRTPTEIFHDLLGAWVGERANTLRFIYGEHGDRARAQLAMRESAYREEFRAALVRLVEEVAAEPCDHGPGRSCPACEGPTREEAFAVADEVPFSAPEQALADANPSTYPEILPPGQPVKPPRVGPGDHELRPPGANPFPWGLNQTPLDIDDEPETIPDRGERLAERYTRPNGSPK